MDLNKQLEQIEKLIRKYQDQNQQEILDEIARLLSLNKRSNQSNETRTCGM